MRIVTVLALSLMLGTSAALADSYDYEQAQKKYEAEQAEKSDMKPEIHTEPKSDGRLPPAKEVGETIGEGAADAGRAVGDGAKAVGHGVRDTTKTIGHTTRDFFRGIGRGLRGE
ncbi:MAG: hypothetical protein Q7T44_05945 [Parvibaculum sp.]|nr:hypothetical protein [Parvibaculum sp.]